MGPRTEWDQHLLAARAGDERALSALVEFAREDLKSAVAGVLGRAARRELPSDDLFEEAMLSALRELGSLRATSYLGFRVWFTTIARNHVCRTMRRSRSRARVLSDGDLKEAEPVDPATTDECQHGEVRGSLERLPRSQQAALVLREGLQLSWRTIGFVLERRGIPATRLIHYRATRGVKNSIDVRPASPVLDAGG